MTQYAVVIEHEGNSYGAYVPDLPGCVAIAETEVRPTDSRGYGVALAVALAS